jgi:hypothetical protein
MNMGWWYWECDTKEGPGREGEGEDLEGTGEEGAAAEDWEKGGKSGMGREDGGGALLNAGPAHLVEGGEGPLSFGGELLSMEKGVLSDLSTKRFSWKLV